MSPHPKTTMNKKLAILALSVLPLHAQVDVRIGNTKTYTMTDAKTAQYIDGRTYITIKDGSWALAPCIDDPSPVIVYPYIFCPLGTTAFIWRGDADRDGVRDDGSYWSVSSITRASVIKPFVADRVSLAAAPPSKLVRPFGNFADESVGLYYDVVNPPAREYSVAWYTHEKLYGFSEGKKHADEYVPGTYVFRIPSLYGPEASLLSVSMVIYPAPEPNGYRKGQQGFAILKGRWSKGSQELDPRLLTRVSWAGINPRNTVVSDQVFFSMYEAHPLTGDIVSPERILYPTPDLPYILDSPYQTSLEIIPFAFDKGDRAVARLDWIRSLQTNAVSRDDSQRTFDWRIRFVDSYEGHQFFEYPLGTLNKLRAGKADFDLDGVSNLYEFAFTQDDGDELSSTPEACADPLVQPVMPVMQIDPVSGQAFMTVNKRLNVGSSIIYSVEYSTNGKKWKAITSKDKLFSIVTDTEELLEVRSINPAPPILFMRAVAKEWK